MAPAEISSRFTQLILLQHPHDHGHEVMYACLSSNVSHPFPPLQGRMYVLLSTIPIMLPPSSNPLAIDIFLLGGVSRYR